MDQATWWAMFLALALISGLMSGLVWRLLFANRGIGVGRMITLIVIVLLGAASVLLVGGTIVDELFTANDAVIIPFLLPPAFAITWLIGFRSIMGYRTGARVRGRRQVAASGSHEVTRFVRQAVDGPITTPIHRAPIDDRPLPTPMLVGNRDVTLPPATLRSGVEDLSLPPPPPPPSR